MIIRSVMSIVKSGHFVGVTDEYCEKRTLRGSNGESFKILTLNVCGLKSRTLYPEFNSFLSKYDIIGIQETKTDTLDEIYISGFKTRFKHRRTISNVKSGGICVAYKEKYEQYLRFIETNSNLVQWFVISKKLTQQDDLLCGVVYIPPERSLHAHHDPYHEISEELKNLEGRYSKILILGDFNSRTRTMKDFIEIDQTIFHEADLDCVYEEQALSYQIFENERSSVIMNRDSSDTSVNNYGYKLMNFCKRFSLFILNGRTAGDLPKGKNTCKKVSCIDYFIGNVNMLYMVKGLHVLDFCSLLSDSHNPVLLELHLSGNNLIDGNTVNVTKPNKHLKLWEDGKSELFWSNLSYLKIDSIVSGLSDLELRENISQNDIDCVLEDMNEVFLTAAVNTFGSIPDNNNNNNRKKKKPSNPTWYGPQCKLMRKKWHNAKYRYKLNKTEVNKTTLKHSSKAYKKVMRQSYYKFKKFQVKKLSGLKHSNPKKYWKNLNGSKQETIKASQEQLFDYFKKVNTNTNHIDTESNDMVNENAQINDNLEINCRITLKEIEENVKKLKNNKACGIDFILNEHIKSSFHTMGPLYEKLFNLILDTGIVPETWTRGMIKPVFKQKGDILNPENYRPITLLSCVGKLFTGIISNRLNKYAEKCDLIRNTQAGFRKNHSTIDHIFVMYSLTEMLGNKSKQLFAAFIDLKQAFDTIWRDGLWYKLVNCNITGKCYKLIQNMYQGIKSCLTVNVVQTDYFSCNIGLRQGENLSPFLFSVYLNDLEDFFFKNIPNEGIDCISSELDDLAYIYVKLFLLMYADDTVILSETSEGLQTALNFYSEYCNVWKLKINVSKTKVVVFATGRRGNFSFFLNGDDIEVVGEYKYLGVF